MSDHTSSTDNEMSDPRKEDTDIHHGWPGQKHGQRKISQGYAGMERERYLLSNLETHAYDRTR
jgi:hypothetical protein